MVITQAPRPLWRRSDARNGLIGFARVALAVAQAAVVPYRSKFSKHVFTQPKLLAVLCLMRYEASAFPIQRLGLDF